jgi:hypothetical protein
VGEYNSGTGATINGSFISLNSVNGQLTTDFDLKYFGGDLYVGERFGNSPTQARIGLFDATTGATISNPFVSFNAPNGPLGLAIATVPETSTWAIALLGLGLLVFQIIHAAAYSRPSTEGDSPAPAHSLTSVAAVYDRRR